MGWCNASGRAADGRLHLVRAVDAGIGNPEIRDAFGVVLLPVGTPAPIGVGSPDTKCAARDVVTSPLVAGNLVAVDNPDL